MALAYVVVHRAVHRPSEQDYSSERIANPWAPCLELASSSLINERICSCRARLGGIIRNRYLQRRPPHLANAAKILGAKIQGFQ